MCARGSPESGGCEEVAWWLVNTPPPSAMTLQQVHIQQIGSPCYAFNVKQKDGSQYRPLLAALDIKDAFLQVPQSERPHPGVFTQLSICLFEESPGTKARLSSWYWYFRNFLDTNLASEFCSEQPCLGKSRVATVLMHVDDLLYFGTCEHFHGTFLKKWKEKFSVSHAELGERSSSTLLKKKLVQLSNGILITPGIDVEKIV